MSNIFNSVNSQTTPIILCYYTNHTSQIQIIRLINTDRGKLEKIVFPQQRMLFEATPESQLEIVNHKDGNITKSQFISCSDLEIALDRSSKSLVSAVRA